MDMICIDLNEVASDVYIGPVWFELM